MTKPDLLKHIAQTAYNVGYAAKKHFATYDLAAKAPGSISFLTFGVGLYFLLIDFTEKKYFSAACIILGILGLQISMWEGKKESYLDAGRDLTGLFNKLKALYSQAVLSHRGIGKRSDQAFKPVGLAKGQNRFKNFYILPGDLMK